MKYSRTLSPSLKLEIIGVSMNSPECLAMSPRIPASCLIWSLLPLAPDIAIMYMGLKVPGYSFPFSIRVDFSISSNIALETRFVASDQTSIILLYLSLLVMIPWTYWFQISSVFLRASLIIFSLAFGTWRSSIPMEIPASVERRNPSSFSLSRNLTVSSLPTVM